MQMNNTLNKKRNSSSIDNESSYYETFSDKSF